MEYGRLDNGPALAALVVVGAFVVAAVAAPVSLQDETITTASTAYVDPILRSSLAPGVLTPAILVLEAGPIDGVLSALARLGLEHHGLDQLRMVTVLLDDTTIDLVARIPGVATVYRNERMSATLDQSVDYVGAKVVWSTYKTTGRGATILVMDSGVDGNHPDVKFHANLVENVVPTRTGGGLIGGNKEGVTSSDPDGHGTHVAAIAAGTGKALGGKYRGVAHGAEIIGYQAGLLDAGSGNVEFESLTVLEGFNWALANHAEYSIDIVSNSWGANGEFDPRSPVNIATLNLYKSGLLVLFASGNEGDQGLHSLNKYSVAPWVLSVTAGDYFNQVPAFASRGSDGSEKDMLYDHPDVVAPGVGITSARALHGRLPPTGDTSFYATKSGSSMATPHVAGVAALLLQANPDLSPDDLMDILTGTATPIAHSPTWESGAGYVNALKAYQLAARATGHRDEFLDGKVKYAGPASGDARYARDAVTVGYLKGAAHRLRSPDTSAGEFLHGLVTTPMGLAFMFGSVILGVLAFGLGDRPSPRPTTTWPTGSTLPYPSAPVRPANAEGRPLGSPASLATFATAARPSTRSAASRIPPVTARATASPTRVLEGPTPRTAARPIAHGIPRTTKGRSLATPMRPPPTRPGPHVAFGRAGSQPAVTNDAADRTS